MATHDKYFPGTAVSRYLIPGERSWDEAVYQSGKPVLDSELNLSQEVGKEIRRLVQDRTVPSGWLRGPIPNNPLGDWSDGANPNELGLRKRTALVANMPVVVEYANSSTAGENILQFSAATTYDGTAPTVKRTDFVFLEVWKCVVSHSPRASQVAEVVVNANIVPGDVITLVDGINPPVPLTATAGAPLVDQFQIGVDEATTAANIAAAINLPGNSFTNICTAQTDVSNPNQINLRAADALAGAAGNSIQISLTLANPGAITVGGGAGPVFFSGGADTANKPSQTTIYRHGNTQAPAAVNLQDTIADPVIGTESTKRVQIQYRIRVTGAAEAVNFKAENGFDNGNVLAQGAQASPVAGYQFVPADNSTVVASSDATAYQTVDQGLWIAGDGSSAAATALGTVDGFVYAIPIAFVFRRNDAYNGGLGNGFDPQNNANGALPSTHGGFVNPQVGTILAGDSDRPDGRFHDLLLVADILDLRRQVAPGGIDLKAEMERQMTLLLDGSMKTWALDAADKNQLGAASGDVSTQFLVCNEIGRDAGAGGVAPASGDTTRGDTVANFDHVRRRFADQPIVERRIFPIYPTDDSGTQPGKFVQKASAGFLGWTEGDVINIDLDNLDATGVGDWANNPSGAPVGGGAVSNLWPPGTLVTDVLRCIHDDGWNSGGAPAAPVSKTTLLDRVSGVGSTLVQLTLGPNRDQVNGGDPANPDHDMVAPTGSGDVGSQRRIWVELEITYPTGSGTTDTVDLELAPDPVVYPDGPVLENDSSQRPDDWEDLTSVTFRQSYREIGVEYICNDGSVPGGGSGTPITDTVVSDTGSQITLPRRFWGTAAGPTSGFPLVTNQVTALPETVDPASSDYGSSSRKVELVGSMTGGQTLVSVQYWAQDPLPNFGAVGYQLAVYFRTNAPQTLGVTTGLPADAAMPGGLPTLPTTLTVEPLAMSRDLWTGTVGAGSVDEAFPYSRPLDQIPVNSDTPLADFPGEWRLESLADISIGDFDAQTGLLNLHQLVPADSNSAFEFGTLDVDQEHRLHYKVSDTAAYRPTAMSQPLSGIATHKVLFPFLARASADSILYRKDEVLLVVVTRYGYLDGDNTIAFTDSGNRTCAAIYRTSGLLIMASE